MSSAIVTERHSPPVACDKTIRPPSSRWSRSCRRSVDHVKSQALATERARGPLLWNLRVVGLGASLLGVMGYIFDHVGVAALSLSVLVGVGWQVWLLRPRIYVTRE